MRLIKEEKKWYCGIDVSGDTLDVCYQNPEDTLEWCKITNNSEGFKQIWLLTGKLYHFVKESTGGVKHNPTCYEMPSHLYFECRTINNAIETITTEITSFKNKLHALSKLDIDSKVIVTGYKKILRDLQSELKKFETALYTKLEDWQPALVKQIRSVVGISKRATAILIVSTQGFKYT